MIQIGSTLFAEERQALISLLKEFVNVFAWSHADMPGIDSKIVEHRIPLHPDAKPVKQKLRRMRPDWVLKIKEEVTKQINARFLMVTEYPQWVANIVPVPKKNGSYQRAATILLHDMIHKEVEVYVDDMIVKAKEREGHLPALRKFFERIRKYRMRLNSAKCTFGVTTRKMLKFMITT
ncbi:uncharacterized protein LOC131309473 [Rhododendron vialii]|uniref:uncharacterized protein LOC131309473 n=1 Tax=Rhododendron vialii TaxID=182163 RepID=UPI00265E7917|nr:uncharacterized protein LOC131309473 [Rhododendron vialii]